MNKVLSIFLICLIVVGLSACGTSPTNVDTAVNSSTSSSSPAAGNQGAATVAFSSTEPNNSETVSTPFFDANAVASKITVEGETYYSYSYNLILRLTNNSDEDCDISVSVDFYNSDDSIVGTSSRQLEAFAKGTTCVMVFSNDDPFTRYEYTIKASQLSYYECVDQNLSCEVSTASGKAIISVTNNGEITAHFVEYNALFYSGGTLIYTDWGYMDTDIKPGETVKEEARCYEDFDSVTVYTHGQSEVDLRL